MCNQEGFGDAGYGSDRSVAPGSRGWRRTLKLDIALWAGWRGCRKDVRDLENMIGKKNQQAVGLLNW